MRYFVTGASGWIGSAVTAELLAAGHEVVGLARSDASAAALTAAGARVRRGEVGDLETLAAAAADSDGVVHLAFDHERAFAGDFDAAAAIDRRAIEALGEALAGTGRPLVAIAGTGVAPGRVATEEDGHDLGDSPPTSGPELRRVTGELALSLADRGVRSCLLRLPPTNHGKGDNGFVALLIAAAREGGVAGYVGDGANRWPAVHRLDSARLACLALEAAPAGSTLHAVAEEGVPTRAIAEAIARGLGVPARSVSAEEMAANAGFVGAFFGMDIPASSAATRELLGWEPTELGLLEDIEQGHYFAAAGAPAGD